MRGFKGRWSREVKKNKRGPMLARQIPGGVWEGKEGDLRRPEQGGGWRGALA